MHRDLKETNIFIYRDEEESKYRCKIGDFTTIRDYNNLSYSKMEFTTFTGTK